MNEIIIIYLFVFVIDVILGFIDAYSPKISSYIFTFNTGFLTAAFVYGGNFSLSEGISDWHWLGIIATGFLGWALGQFSYGFLRSIWGRLNV